MLETVDEKTKLENYIEKKKQLEEERKQIDFRDVIDDLPENYGLMTTPVPREYHLILLHSSERKINGKSAAILIDTSIVEWRDSREDHTKKRWRVDLSPFCEEWELIENDFRWYMGNGRKINLEAGSSDEKFYHIIKSCSEYGIKHLYVSHSASIFSNIRSDFPLNLAHDHDITFYNADSWKHAAHIALGTYL